MEQKVVQVRTSGNSYPSPFVGYFAAFLMMLAYAFAFLDRVVLGLVIDPIRRAFSLNDTQISVLAGLAFVMCFVLFSLPLGRWVDTHGRRNIIVLGIALWSLAMMVCGLATGFWQLFAGRVGVGIGEASLNPAAYSIIPDFFPPHRRAFAMSIYAAGAAVGGGCAVYLGSLLLQWAIVTKPVFPLLGQLAPWKVLFIGAGLPGLLVAVLVMLLMAEPKRHQVGSFKTVTAPIADVIAYVREHGRVFLLTFVGFAGFAINNYGFTVWGPSYFMRVHHFTPSQVGILFGLGFGVGGTLGMLLGGLWSDWEMKAGRVEAPIWVCLRVALIQMPFFVAAYLCTNHALAAIFFVIGMVTASMVGGLQGTMVQSLVPNRMRGQIGGIFLIVVNALGLGLAPTLTAAMTDYVFGGPANIGKSLAVTTVVSLSMAAILLIIVMKSARAQAQAVLEA